MGEEIHTARVAAGLSLRDVGRAAGLSYSQVGRLERGRIGHVSIDVLARCCAVLGLDLSVRAYPVGDPLRDRAHRALLNRLRSLVDPELRWRTEVPLPGRGELRAWDVVIDGFGDAPSAAVAIEAETRLHDGQALERRLAAKRRDGEVGRLILLIADTRSNRSALPALRLTLTDQFPLGNSAVLTALAGGRPPPANGIVVL